MRVHALAKEYGIKSTEFVDIIQGFGIDVKSHLSVLDDGQVSDIKHKMKLQEEFGNGNSEETIVPEGEWEMVETSGDATAERVSITEVEKEIAKNAEAAGKARVEYAKSVNTSEESEELTLTESDLDEESFDEYKDEDAPDDPSHSKFFPKETEDEWSKREQVLENLREKSKENVASQEVIVEKPKGFWGWLKSLFS